MECTFACIYVIIHFIPTLHTDFRFSGFVPNQKLVNGLKRILSKASDGYNWIIAGVKQCH